MIEYGKHGLFEIKGKDSDTVRVDDRKFIQPYTRCIAQRNYRKYERSGWKGSYVRDITK